VDAVIHLAGENIVGRWTAERKQRVMQSRKTGTRLLAEAVARATKGPRTLISASAIGYYGDRGEEPLTEVSGPGQGFLPEVVAAWEQATEPASEAGVRVVKLRLGLVLTPAGGLLRRMRLPFRLGLGGRLGSGTQWMSWIAADDMAGVFHHALITESLSGAANLVTQYPVRNAEFTKTLGSVLRRPTPFPVPAAILRLIFGQMADEVILASTRAMPTVLSRSGYRFRFPVLRAALSHLLGASPNT
jgi:hypothetical protein